jgi:hypothetical protein
VKLSHWDFRPSRRSKYVSPPPRRRPTLRILILAAFGILVYLKFDSFLASRAFLYLRHPGWVREVFARYFPGETRPGPSAFPGRWLWSGDSSQVELICESDPVDVCLEPFPPLGPEKMAFLRSLIYKARVQLDIPSLSGFSAVLQKKSPEVAYPGQAPDSLELERLELRSSVAGLNHAGQGHWVFSAYTSGSARTGSDIRYCMADKRCLDDFRPALPFGRLQRLESAREESGPALHLIPWREPVFRPILPGRIVETPYAGARGNRVKLYHGRNIFSYYRNFAALKPGLVAGDFLEDGDTLGFVSGEGDSLRHLSLQIEKDGVLVDPGDFLGLHPDSAKVAMQADADKRGQPEHGR